MTCYAGHATLFKSVLKPGYEFDQLLVLGILHSLDMIALFLSPLFLQLCFISVQTLKKKKQMFTMLFVLFLIKKWNRIRREKERIQFGSILRMCKMSFQPEKIIKPANIALAQ